MFVPKPEPGVVLLNCFLYEPQLRAAGAHELGHSAFEHGAHLDDKETVELDDGRGGWNQSLAGDYVERLANAFARCFLLPGEGLASELGENEIDSVMVLHLARTFGTTYGLVALQLLKLDRIDAATRRQLLARKETDIAAELRSKRTGGFPEEYLLLAIKAYRRSKIGFDRLTGLLRLTSADEINQLREILELRKLLHEDDRLSEASPPAPEGLTLGA
jgi:hypothetical protein